jgi:hypothetical protein
VCRCSASPYAASSRTKVSAKRGETCSDQENCIRRVQPATKSRPL